MIRLGLGVVLLSLSCAAPRSALPIRIRGEQVENRPGGGLSADEIIAVTWRNKDALAACVIANQGLDHGKIILVWDVRPDGTVDNVGVTDPGYAKHSLAYCFTDAVKTWRFPATQSGTAAIAFPMKY